MRKIEMVRVVRDVMSGKNAHTYIVFGMKENGSWDYETSINKIEIDNSEWTEVGIASHCCNNISIQEVKEYIEKQFRCSNELWSFDINIDPNLEYFQKSYGK